jgi:hypothetical protein
MDSMLKSYQKKLKNSLRASGTLITSAHRKIVLGGTTGRRTIRLRRPVFFCTDRVPWGLTLLASASFA